MGFGDLLGAASKMGGLGDIAKLAAGNPQILAAAAALLNPSDNSVGGGMGLTDLVKMFNSNGLGDVMASWTGTGTNKSVDPGQLAGMLGNDTMSQFASVAGIDVAEAGSALASVLPGLVDKLSPDGDMPDTASLQSALGGLMGALG